MSVKIVPKFTKADIRRMVEQKKQRILDAITLRLQMIGEKFVANARNNGDYKDQTGNLRGSIGYVVLYNGAQLHASLEGTVDGVRFAKKAIADISAKYPTGFCLIGVAGMEYAFSVETNGKDVITSSSITAADDLKKAMKRIQKSSNS